MCGIAGFCDFTKKSDKKTLQSITDVLYHRGPDDNGYSFYENEFAHVGLGHRRLSILDLSAHGHQPMSFEHLDIVFNGEVYNFKEIKKELLEIGYEFYSNSDTEVNLQCKLSNALKIDWDYRRVHDSSLKFSACEIIGQWEEMILEYE